MNIEPQNLTRNVSVRIKMGADEFRRISSFVKSEAGLLFTEQKAPMMESRLIKRLRKLGLSSFNDYCDLIENPDETQERSELISALTTNVTSFFREPHHFETLRTDVIPQLQKRKREGHPIRVWSAGCSRGHEPYSIAMELLAADPAFSQHDLMILASDIDPKVLQVARQGIYETADLQSLPEGFQERFFTTSGDSNRINAELREMIRFNPLNLLQPWPMKTQFDIIFCRNVVIYFDQSTQDTLWPKFQNATRKDGWLFIGHSERLTAAAAPQYASVGMTTYQKTS